MSTRMSTGKGRGLFSAHAIVQGLSAALIGYGLFSMHTAHIPGDLDSEDYFDGSKARYSYINEDGDKVQQGYYELTVPIVSAFDRHSQGFVPGGTVFNYTIDPTTHVGTIGTTEDFAVAMGSPDGAEGDCSTVGGTFSTTGNVCSCFDGDEPTTPTGYIGKHCSIWTGLKAECIGTTCTFKAKDAKNLMVFNTRRMVIWALAIIFASLVVSFLTTAAAAIIPMDNSPYSGIIAQCLGRAREDETESTTPSIVETIMMYAFALMFAALMAIVLSVVYVAIQGAGLARADASDVDDDAHGVYASGSISGRCILFAMFFSLVIANRFFVNAQKGDRAGSTVSYTIVTVVTSAAGAVAAMLYCLSLYFALCVDRRIVVQELVVATCVFLFLWVIASLVSIVNFVYVFEMDENLSTFFKAVAAIGNTFAGDPRAFLASFAFAVTSTLFVVMRKAQNLHASDGSTQRFGMYYQLGAQADVCNYIGAEAGREGYSVAGTCKDKDGTADWAVHGVWIMALGFWVVCTVIVSLRTFTAGLKSTSGAVQKVLTEGQRLINNKNGTADKTEARPMRYSRIRVATSV